MSEKAKVTYHHKAEKYWSSTHEEEDPPSRKSGAGAPGPENASTWLSRFSAG
jgi:hypothetical protein